MSNDSNFNASGNSSSTATAEHSNSLRAQVEAEKQAKIEELLAPYRVKRAELQAKREELAEEGAASERNGRTLRKRHFFGVCGDPGLRSETFHHSPGFFPASAGKQELG